MLVQIKFVGSNYSYLNLFFQLNSHLDSMKEILAPPLYLAISKMLNVNPKCRPSMQMFCLNKYFHDTALSCLLQLDNVDSLDKVHRIQFYYSQLRDTLYLIPQV